MTFDKWKKKGNSTIINGHRIFFVDINPHLDKVICILHGYPTCSFDYYKILPYFKDFRIIIHDHLGFGFSDKPADNKYLLKDQATIALTLWKSLNLKQIHLVAHDYGTSVATEIIARNNNNELSVKLSSLTLCNGSMLIKMAKLRWIQKLLKHPMTGKLVAQLGSEHVFIRNMKQIWFDKSSFDKEEMKHLWKMMLFNNGRNVLPTATQYINQRYEFYDRWIGALKETKMQTLILWAENDPVAIIEMADVLGTYISNSSIVTLPQTGHYPMIENPNLWSKLLLKFINNLENKLLI